MPAVTNQTIATVIAVEPSATMIAQRPAGAAPAVRAFAESLPFRDSTFDAALAIFTVHHWRDTQQGLREIARVSRRQVILSYDAVVELSFWLVDEYFPEIAQLDAQSTGYTSQAISEVIDVRRVETVMVPADCIDGFAACSGIGPRPMSIPRYKPASRVWRGSTSRHGPAAPSASRADLASGAWDERHGYLRTLRERDFGYRLIIAGDEVLDR